MGKKKYDATKLSDVRFNVRTSPYTEIYREANLIFLRISHATFRASDLKAFLDSGEIHARSVVQPQSPPAAHTHTQHLGAPRDTFVIRESLRYRVPVTTNTKVPCTRAVRINCNCRDSSPFGLVSTFSVHTNSHVYRFRRKRVVYL